MDPITGETTPAPESLMPSGDVEIWAFSLELAESVREEKLSRWSMQVKIGERFPHLTPDELAQAMQRALSHALGGEL